MSENETAKIRVAMVDDHEMFRAGVIATLRDSFDIVGQAADVPGSVAMIAQTKPQVVLLDVHVPGGEVAAVARDPSPNRRTLRPPTPPCSGHCRFRMRRRMWGRDSRRRQGYVTKTITGADLISSIKQVHELCRVLAKTGRFCTFDLPGCAGGGV